MSFAPPFLGRRHDILQYSSSIAAFIESACGALEEDARLRIVLLLVEELFVNRVNHGYGGECDEPVWLTVEVDDEDCRLVYEDCAPDYDPFASVDSSSTDGDLDQRRIGDLGIVLLVEFSPTFGFWRAFGTSFTRSAAHLRGPGTILGLPVTRMRRSAVACRAHPTYRRLSAKECVT
jgi:anti-sigma regulatory factor (Ser/Thr protein kinase)